MKNDLTDVKELLRRFNIYVYDRDEQNMYMMMDMELSELYRNHLITKEEFLNAKLILKKRMNETQ
jgi:uncharacterized protein YqgQ